MGLILRPTPINNTVEFDHSHTAIQTYALFVQGQHDTRSTRHSINNKDRCMTIVNIYCTRSVVSVFEMQNGVRG